MKKQSDAPRKIALKLILIGLLFVFGSVVFLIGSQNSNKEIIFSSTGDNAVDYRVFLKENDFFEEPFIGAGKTYITSLIDHIDVDFKYVENFSEEASGEFTYYLKAIISADKTENAKDNEIFWTKEYQLTEPKTITFDNTRQSSFNASVSVDYPYYNSILESFREQYPVASDGTIKVSLVVEDVIRATEFKDPLQFDSELNISLPLLEKAVEAKIDVETGNRAHEFATNSSIKNPIYDFIKLLGIGMVLLSVVLAAVVVIKRRVFINRNQYISTLDKILETNDSIITNIENMPNLSKFQKFEVQTFYELLDDYSDIRLPINFYQNKSGTESTFFITNDGIVWIYCLKKRNLGS